MKNNIKFIKLFRVATIFSVALIIIGFWYIMGPSNLKIGPLTPKGFDFSIDFKGGTIHQLRVYSGISIGDIRNYTAESGLGTDIQEVILSGNKKVGNMSSYIIKSTITRSDEEKLKENSNITSAQLITSKIEKLYELIKNKTGETYTLEGEELAKIRTLYDNIPGLISSQSDESKIVVENVVKESESVISISYSKELFFQSIFLILFVLAIMLIYITLRFKINYAVGAILALLHDTLLILGVISFFGVEFNYSVVAAILTLIGYSINDTIVIFDRVRENTNLMKEYDIRDIINVSINQTLTRSIITSLTTFLAVFALYAFGGPAIKDFSFVFMIGIIIGTYSSVFIAAPTVLIFDKLVNKKTTANLKRIDDDKNFVNKDTNSDSSSKNDETTDDNIVLSKNKLKKLSGSIKKK